MTQQIPLQTLLGDRYKVTAHVLETADGDVILDGLDQILNRKVSIVVANPANASFLVANARKSAALTRSTVQVLDLGNYKESTYLVTSHARSDVLLDTLLTDGGAEAEEFGEEIFGDTGTMKAPNSYVVAKDSTQGAAAGSISATRDVTPAGGEAEEFEEYNAEEDGYYEAEEPSERNGGKWLVGIAAVLVLVIAAGAVFASLGGMVDTDVSQEALGGGVGASTSASASTSPAASASASPTESKLPAPELRGNFTRTVPGNPTQMADSDGMLGNLTDGNPSTTWLSLSFGSPNFGGLFTNFYFTGQLQEASTVNSVTINQVSGTGGSFTVLTGSSDNISDAKQVGSGSFAASGETTVELDKKAQDGDTKYIFIRFDEAPTLSQPIVAGYPYGLRLAEISIK